MAIEEREEERDGERGGGIERLIDMEWESNCFWGVEIKRKRSRDGGGREGRTFIILDVLILV